jgi:hypothetical protein
MEDSNIIMRFGKESKFLLSKKFIEIYIKFMSIRILFFEKKDFTTKSTKPYKFFENNINLKSKIQYK